MKVDEIRAIYWKAHTQLQTTSTLDRQLQLYQLQVEVEIAVQLAEMNEVLKKIGLLNFEEIALRLEDIMRKTED